MRNKYHVHECGMVFFVLCTRTRSCPTMHGLFKCILNLNLTSAAAVWGACVRVDARSLDRRINRQIVIT